MQKRINNVFPSITKEQIKDIYKKRSDFVHGETKINVHKDYSDIINGVSQFDDAPLLAVALLIESIRLLIANNAKSILFNEHISHKFK